MINGVSFFILILIYDILNYEGSFYIYFYIYQYFRYIRFGIIITRVAVYVRSAQKALAVVVKHYVGIVSRHIVLKQPYSNCSSKSDLLIIK